MLPQRTTYFCSPSLYSFVVFRFCFCMLIVCSPNRVPSPVQLLFLLLFWFCSSSCCCVSVSLSNCACCCCHPWKWHSMPPYSFCCIVPLGNEGGTTPSRLISKSALFCWSVAMEGAHSPPSVAVGRSQVLLPSLPFLSVRHFCGHSVAQGVTTPRLICAWHSEFDTGRAR